jgi:hypothetical protein
MKIYLAGPLFSAAERAFNALLAGRLRTAGHKVWLPAVEVHHRVGSHPAEWAKPGLRPSGGRQRDLCRNWQTPAQDANRHHRVGAAGVTRQDRKLI